MSHRPKKQTATGIPRDSATELYQVLFEQAADGIFIADALGRFEMSKAPVDLENGEKY